MRGLFAITTFVACTGIAAAQPQYMVIDLGTLGGNLSRGLGINPAGPVAGSSRIANGEIRAFRWTPGAGMTNLGTLGGTQSEGLAIGAGGHVAGYSFLTGTTDMRAFRTSPIGFVSDPGTDLGTFGGRHSIAYDVNASGQSTGYGGTSMLTTINHAFRTTLSGTLSNAGADLGTLGGTTSEGRAINTSGQVTGFSHYTTANNDFHAYRTTASGNLSDPNADLGTLGGRTSIGLGINDAGRVVGYSTFAGSEAVFHAFRTTATGKVSDPATDLGTLGGLTSVAWSINSTGLVVGTSDIANGDDHAFVHDTQMRDLNNLIAPGSGWILTRAFAISDSGHITGHGLFSGEEHAFVLIPVPEPACVFAVAAAVGFGGRFLRWRIRYLGSVVKNGLDAPNDVRTCGTPPPPLSPTR